MNKVLIAGSARTPIGIYDGRLKDHREQSLAVIAAKAVLERTGIGGEDVDELIVGIAKQTSSPSNAARYIGLAADIPEPVPAYTVQRQGASGMQAVINGFMKIRAGSAGVILAGGAESMTQIPYEIQNARYSFSPDKIVMDPIGAMVAGGQPEERYGRLTIGQMNDAVAAAHGYSLAAQRAYAQASLEKAGVPGLDEALTPVAVKVKKTQELVTEDELYAQANVTAGPADAAAMCVLMDGNTAQRRGIRGAAELVSVGISAGSPGGAGMVGTRAIREALKKAGRTAADMDMIEINEITAAQAMAAIEELGLPEGARERVNPFGGALATGNAWGASGCIALHRLLYGLRARGGRWGLAVCGAEGGQALAAVIRIC